MKFTLNGNEKKIDVTGMYTSVKNNSGTIVYISNEPNIDAAGTSCTPIQPNESLMISTLRKKFYIKGTGDIAVVSGNQPVNFFKPAGASSGGSSGGGVSQSYVDNADTATLASAKSYTDSKTSALDDRITTTENAIDTLNGTGEGSVKKTVNDSIAEVVAGAPEDFDTLKEMSDWISGHPDSAAEMNSRIQDNTNNISKLKTAIDTHAAELVYSESGVHGLRYYENKLQVKNEAGEWLDIGTGGGTGGGGDEPGGGGETGTTLNDKNVGDIVKIKENGTDVNYIIVNKGLPSDMYDSSCDGVWLLREKSHSSRAWDGTLSSYDNGYENSDIKAWLNGEFLNSIDSKIRAAIKTVKIPYKKGKGNSSTGVQSGANGLSCKIFLLGGYEVGFTTADNQYLPIDGARLSYFLNGNSDSAAKTKRICKDSAGSAVYWWLRSADTSNAYNAWRVDTDGTLNDYNAGYGYAVRPAFVLPSNLAVDDDGNVKA